MDLHTIASISRPNDEAELPKWTEGSSPLGGGTWLFSEPQPGLRHLIDLAGLRWDELTADESGLRIGAMCRFGALAGLQAPSGWRAAALFGACCDALVGSFKVQEVATVGGNVCLALPAGPIAALLVALDGICVVRAADGGERLLPAIDFIVGERRTVLGRGDLLRAMRLPARALARRAAFRRLSLSAGGRSAALLIGTAGDRFALTVTAATKRPVRLEFGAVPRAGALRAALREAIPDELLHDDVHGDPEWRRHGTEVLAEEIRLELGGTRCG